MSSSSAKERDGEADVRGGIIRVCGKRLLATTIGQPANGGSLLRGLPVLDKEERDHSVRCQESLGGAGNRFVSTLSELQSGLF